MRVLVTGSQGFVGGWLTREMESAGHEVIEVPQVDVTDRIALREALVEARPDAVAHLAAVAFAPEAASDPGTAFKVATGGTLNIFEAARGLPRKPVILVTGSSEVYGAPQDPSLLPLTERSALAPLTPYAISKAAQESVALAYAARYGMSVVVTRSFSHTGPGQRPVFVVPALAQRIMAAARGLAADVPVGNLDVKRDMSDVRDVVVAYRLLLEAAAAGRIPVGGTVINVCSGRAVSIKAMFDELCRVAGFQPRVRVDPALTRPNEAPEIRGDPGQIAHLTGWRAAVPLSQTLADVWTATDSQVTAAAV